MKGKKKKSKKGPKGGTKQHIGEQKKDMSKVKCFACQKFGHYVGQCPNKNKKKQKIESVAEIDDYVVIFERDFFPFVGGCIERASFITGSDIEDHKEHFMIVGIP